MILTCENCKTRYLLPTHALGMDGRRVRCTNCGHEWYQEPDDIAAAEAPPEDVEPMPESVMPVPEDSGLPALFEPMPEVPPTPPQKGRMAGYAVAALIFVVIAGALFVFRETIIRAWPPAWELYNIAHAAPPLPGEGLILSELSAVALTNERGVSVLNIRGSIVNLNDRNSDIPPLQATLQRADGTPVDQWRIELAQEAVGPHGELRFKSEYAALPDDVQDVNLRLVSP